MRPHLKLADAALRLRATTRWSGTLRLPRHTRKRHRRKEHPMFLRNYWYVAGYDHEIGRRPFRRVIMGEPIVFWRREDGTPAAARGSLSHRRLPLSIGKLAARLLQCHYHGLRYDRPARASTSRGRRRFPIGAGPVLSGGRALSLGLDLDGRSGAGRSEHDCGLPLDRRARNGVPAVRCSTSTQTGCLSSTTCST